MPQLFPLHLKHRGIIDIDLGFFRFVLSKLKSGMHFIFHDEKHEGSAQEIKTGRNTKQRVDLWALEIESPQ